MDINRNDGGGIIGTPLEMRSLFNHSSRSQFKISAADRIAPPQEVYENLREQEQKQKEKALQDEAAIQATGAGHLYRKSSKGHDDLTLNSIMDDEDRAHVRLSIRTHRAKAGVQGNRELNALLPVQFAVAATEMPEVVPRARETSVGHAILRKSRDLETAPRPKSRFSRANSSLSDRYRLAEFIAFASLGKTDKMGLGYTGREKNAEEKQAKVVKRGSRLAFIEKEKEGHGNANTEDDLDDVANTGYKDLDSAVDRIQLSLLRQRRKENKRAKESRKRFAHIAGLEDADKILHSDFEETNVLMPSGKQESFVVPNSFAAKPIHDFEHDQYRNRSSHLPDYLQRECDMLAMRHRQIHEQEERIVKAAVAKAEERREERLRKMREKFSLDMQSNFVTPSQSRLDTKSAGEVPPTNNKKEDSWVNSTKNVEVGRSNRRVEKWSPLPPLCNGFGIPVPKNSELASGATDSKSKAWDELTDLSDDSDFRIHAIIGADGRRIDFQRASLGLLADDEVIIKSTESAKIHGEKTVETNPSKELFSAIFGEILPKQEHVRASEPSDKSRDVSTIPSQPEGERMQKTQIADLF